LLVNKATASVVIALGLVVTMAAGCSRDSGSDGPASTGVTTPKSTGAMCTDPAGDLSADSAQTSGSLSEPSGIDLTRVEAKVVDTGLQVAFTTVGPVASAPSPLFVVEQGEPGQLKSFEIRLAPSGVDASGWTLTLVTWEGVTGGNRGERRSTLTETATVRDNTVAFEIAGKDLPSIASLLWQFGSSSGEGEQAPFDDCNTFTDDTSGSTVPATTVPGVAPPTTVAVAGLGESRAFRTGSIVTVFAAQSPPATPKAMTVPADEGFQLAVVDVQICAGDKPVEARGAYFGVKLDDNRIYPIRREPEPGADPGFPVSLPLPPGQCVRGWVTVQIPTGAALSQVLYSPNTDGSGALLWTVVGAASR
jgi:hypothetical protein